MFLISTRSKIAAVHIIILTLYSFLQENGKSSTIITIIAVIRLFTASVAQTFIA